MPDAQVLHDSIAGNADAPSPASVCSLTLAGCSGDLEIGDIDQVESPVAALAQLADEEPVR